MANIITVTYEAVDGCGGTRTYKTLAGAQKFAQARVGKTPELGSFQAVSPDGIVVLWAHGVTLAELFPALAPKAAPAWQGYPSYAAMQDGPQDDPYDPAADGWAAEAAHEADAEAQGELGAVALAGALAAALAAIDAQHPECGFEFLAQWDGWSACNLPAGHDGAHAWLPF